MYIYVYIYDIYMRVFIYMHIYMYIHVYRLGVSFCKGSFFPRRMY